MVSLVVKAYLAAVFTCTAVIGVNGSAISCGTQQISPRSDEFKVKGGSDAVAGSWPWQVRLGIRSGNGYVSWICGGSILTERYVITAAHCLTGGLNAQYVVRAGDHDQQRTEASQVDHSVLRLAVHPSYGGQSRNYINDMAVLRVAQNLTFKAQISPVCLPKEQEELPSGANCMVTGWGQTGPSNANYRSALQQGRVQIIGKQVCNSAQYWGGMVNSNVQICAGTPNGSVDACKGDSGGPLVCQDAATKKWVLHGIVSWGPISGCGSSRTPAVYTKVSNFIPWIKTTTGNSV